MNDLVLGIIGGVGVLAGLAGTIVPVMPGLLLLFVAAAGTLLGQGTSGPIWGLVAALAVLAVIGTALSAVLPARRVAVDGAPRRSLAIAGVGAIVGFFVVPVLGLLVGGVLGLLLAEQQRLGEFGRAWASARRVISSYGIGVVLELLIGCLMGAVWLSAFVTRAT